MDLFYFIIIFFGIIIIIGLIVKFSSKDKFDAREEVAREQALPDIELSEQEELIWVDRFVNCGALYKDSPPGSPDKETFTGYYSLIRWAATKVVDTQSPLAETLQGVLKTDMRFAELLIRQLESIGVIAGRVSPATQLTVIIKTEEALSAFLKKLPPVRQINNLYFKYKNEIQELRLQHILKLSVRLEILKNEKKKRQDEEHRRLQQEAYSELADAGLIQAAMREESLGRQPIPKDVMDAVWNRDGGRCVKCGSQESLEFDHIIPFSKGGANTYRNLQILCKKCNIEKSNKIG